MASRFWVGGTGTWDASSTTHWAASSGGASGASVPGSADSVTFDASSGGGTVTSATDININTLTFGAFTGTLDFSVNNNNVTANVVSGTGSGTRTLKMGGGTWTVSASAQTLVWNFIATTNLTLDAGTSTLVFSGSHINSLSFSGGGQTYHNVQISGNAGGGGFSISSSNTFADLRIDAPNFITLSGGTTQTIATATIVGSSAAQIAIESSTPTSSIANISAPSGSISLAWCSLRELSFSGGATFAATNSFDLGNNSGITITAPSGGGGSGGLLINPGMSGGMVS